MRSVPYVGRPGIPPAVAALVAAGRIRKTDRILDVGCGTGTDALLLSAWGFRHVDAVDPDRAAIATARRRATRRHLNHRVRFQVMPAEGLLAEFGPRRFDVVLHTLVANNLGRRKDEHFRNVAAVLRADGLLVLHERLGRGWANVPPGRVAPLAAVRRHFELAPGVTTHLAEGLSSGPGHAVVALWLGRPRPN
ncbi:MAG: class I SAM-dependent methyltransferase [Thermoplasmatota archaeon]|nr:class I SAM-dependent methyltransferase [Halobacteriales archaeon]